jgi:hypothetical protein
VPAAAVIRWRLMRSCRPPVVLLWTGLVYFIHPPSESGNSRKLPLRIVQPYALGPGLSTFLPRSSTPEAGTLLHCRIKIRSGGPYPVGPGIC